MCMMGVLSTSFLSIANVHGCLSHEYGLFHVHHLRSSFPPHPWSFVSCRARCPLWAAWLRPTVVECPRVVDAQTPWTRVTPGVFHPPSPLVRPLVGAAAAAWAWWGMEPWAGFGWRRQCRAKTAPCWTRLVRVGGRVTGWSVAGCGMWGVVGCGVCVGVGVGVGGGWGGGVFGGGGGGWGWG